jgi:hypothetical protein
MEDKKLRKRVLINQKGNPPVFDPLFFEQNKCSPKAAKRISQDIEFNVELWFDKHYHDRVHRGDENGPRDGIEERKVEKLVLKAIQFLYYFASAHPNFSFINRENNNSSRYLRIVLRELNDEFCLNVVIECHYLTINSLEITVKTAMSKTDFQLSDNQYCIEINGSNSTLIKFTNGKEVVISEI